MWIEWAERGIPAEAARPHLHCYRRWSSIGDGKTKGVVGRLPVLFPATVGVKGPGIHAYASAGRHDIEHVFVTEQLKVCSLEEVLNMGAVAEPRGWMVAKNHGERVALPADDRLRSECEPAVTRLAAVARTAEEG
ncbi:MAG: hypothetical protein WKF33_02435 [Thermoleophilaceae bacterium]